MLRTDETPAPPTTEAARTVGCGNPYLYTVPTMLAYTGGGADLIWHGAAGNRTSWGSPASGSWTATAGSWSATTTAVTSATTPGSPESSSAWPTCTGTLTTPTPSTQVFRSGARQAGDALRAAAVAVPGCPDAGQASLDPLTFLPGCAIATTRPSPSRSR